MSRARLGAAAAWTIAMLVVMWAPSPEGPPTFEHADKVVHFGSFFVFALLWRRAGASVAISLAIGVGFAALTEYGQGLLPWPRTPDVLDFAFDVAGVSLLLVVETVWRRLRKRETPPQR